MCLGRRCEKLLGYEERGLVNDTLGLAKPCSLELLHAPMARGVVTVRPPKWQHFASDGIRTQP